MKIICGWLLLSLAELTVFANVSILKEELKKYKCKEGFEKITQLGEGAAGIVYKAVPQTKKSPVKLVALKEFFPPSEDEKLARFNEIKAAMTIKSKNVVKGICWLEDKNSLSLALEFVNGNDLIEPAEKDLELSQDQILKIAFEVLKGLAAIHEKNLIHSDIKPDNIMLSNDNNEAIIVDLGSVQNSPANNTELTTPIFKAPEMYVPGASYDNSVDYWALAVTLYFLGHPKHERPYSDQEMRTYEWAVNDFQNEKSETMPTLKKFPMLDKEKYPLINVILKLLGNLDPKQRKLNGEELAAIPIFQDFKKKLEHLQKVHELKEGRSLLGKKAFRASLSTNPVSKKVKKNSHVSGDKGDY